MTLVVESVSDAAYLVALDRRIGDLSGQRRMLFSAAHELAHYVLDSDATNNTGMSAVFDALRLIQSRMRAERPAGSSSPAKGDPLWQPAIFSFAVPVSAHHLPPWTTSDFAGMPTGSWLSGSATSAHVPTADELPAIMGMLNASVSLPGGGQAALLHLVDLLLAEARLCLIQITLLARERPPILARLGRSPGTLAFFLIVLAACRRYGHRSEPDDHASLVIRRQLVSMGSLLAY
jgi:hypothetical protein